MGIVNHKELIGALDCLKDTPAYRVKGIYYYFC